MNKLSKMYLTAALLASTIYLNAQQTPPPPAPKAVTTTSGKPATATTPKTATTVSVNGEDVVIVEGKLTNVQYKKRDTANLKSKEINAVYDVSKSADVIIENSHRNLEIKTWDQPKVKVVTTVYFEGDGSKLSDEEWLERLNISIKSTPSMLRVKSSSGGSGSYTINGQSYGFSWSGDDNVAVVSSGSKNAKKGLVIYVPKENKLEVESRYANVVVSSDVNKLKLDITNGNADLGSVNNLILRSKYGNLSAGNVKTGEIEFLNGRLSLKNSDDLDLDTKYSTVEIDAVKKLNFHSTNDEYEFEEVGSMQGSKNYGNLRVTKLTESADLSGTNADVKFRNIDAGVTSIKIDDKYADLRLPLKNVKNYNIDVKGTYNTVYGEKSITTENKSDNGYTASAGTGKGATVSVKCQNCTIDFK